MSVRSDTINLNVNINGDKSREQLNKLRKSASDITAELQQMKKGTQEYADKKKELAAVQQEMVKLKQQIGLTSLTQKELTRELSTLKNLQGSVTPFTEEYKKLGEQIKAVESRLYDVKNGVQGFASFLSKIKDEVKQFGLMAAAYLGFEFITDQFSSIIGGAGKLSDSLADIRRVTGLTAEEVKHLNTQLGDLDTRTSTADLRGIAVIAGKLGVAKDEILDFVAATDKLVVALGDELGDADSITTELGKIIGVFDKGDGNVTGEKLTAIGNAIVDLANKGVASGGFIVDFTQRMAGLAKTANLSLDSTLALAAGLEEAGQSSESSSTAIIKVLGEIGKDVPKFAKAAGKSVEEFSKTLREKPAEALIQVSEGLTKGKNGFEEISKAFKDVGEDGAKVITTLGVIGGKSEEFRTKIAETTDALKESNQINDAFILKNETMGATLNKLSKEFASFTSSSMVTGFLQGATENALSFLKWIREIPAWVERNAAALKILTVAMIILNANRLKSIGLMALELIGLGNLTKGANATRSAKLALAVVTNLLSGNLAKATQAFSLLSTVIKANPLGLLLTVVGLVTLAFNAFSGSIKKTTAEQRVLAEVQARAATMVNDQVVVAERLKKILTDTNSTLEQKKNAYNELIKLNPAFINTLKLDAEGHLQGVHAIDQYILSLKRKSVAEAREAVAGEKRKQITDDSFKLKEQISTDDLSLLAQQMVQKLNNPNGYKLTPEVRKKIGDAGKQLTDDFQKAISANPETAVTIIDNAYKMLGVSADKSKMKFNDQYLQIKKKKEELKVLDDITEKELRTSLSGPQTNDIVAPTGLDAEQKKAAEAAAKERAAEAKRKAAEEDKEFERLKKEAAKFYADLKKMRDRAGLLDDDGMAREIAELEGRTAEMTEKLKAFYDKQVITAAEKLTEQNIITEIRQQELTAIYKKYFDKRFKESTAREYEDSILLLQDYFNELRLQNAQNYADGIINKQEYEAQIQGIDIREKKRLILNADEYSANVKKAEKDAFTLKKSLQKETTQNAIEETEKRKELQLQEALAGAKLAVVISKPGTDGKLKAQKDLLQLQFEQETANMDRTSEMYKLKTAELNQSLKDLDRQYFQEKIDQALVFIDGFSQALSSVNTLLNNAENRQLAKDKAANEKKKQGFKNQLDNKLISQGVFDKQIQKLQEEQDKREKEIKLKQAKREKALNLFNAIISTAAGIAKAVPNIALMALAGLLGGLQIAAIANAPLPEMGTGGLLKNGPKHSDSDKGLHVVNPRNGRTEMLLEKDEAVLSARAMKDSRQFTVTGTPSQIASGLNGLNGGISWEGGALIQSLRKNPPASINPGMVSIMEQGGIVRPLPGSANNQNNGIRDAKIDQLIQEQQLTRAAITEFKGRLHSVVSIKEFREEEKKYDDSIKASGF